MGIAIEEYEGARIIRLPDNFLKECKPGDQIQIEALNCALLIRPDKECIRSGWAAQFKNKVRKGLDNLLIEEPSVIDKDDWEW